MLTRILYMDARERDLKCSGRDADRHTKISALQFSLCNSAKSIHPSVDAVRLN